VPQTLRIAGGGSLRGEVTPPADKSISHRAFLIPPLWRGKGDIRFRIQADQLGEDALASAAAMQAMGVDVRLGDEMTVAPGPLRSPSSPIDCGNSGTTMRLIAGIIAGSPGVEATLVGDESLSRRPMRRVVDPLRQMGAEIDGDTAPLRISGRRLQGIFFENILCSAQVKSCLLLAGLGAEGQTEVWEPTTSRDHTERMMKRLGAPFLRTPAGDPVVKGLSPWGQPDLGEDFLISVPPDISGAAFWMVGAAIVPGSQVRVAHGLNPTRDGILDVLRAAGIGLSSEEASGGLEESAFTTIATPEALRPFEVSGPLIPRLIDEIPVLCILASQCEGVSRIRDARELRVKESDRLAQMAEGLRAMGVEVEEYEDGLDIHGPARLRGAEIHAHGDHRIAMSFAIAGLIAEGETIIHGAETIATSYPRFTADLESLRAG
jgi:3-phosphoshikimate 1-carboxyvinyltransferase